MYAIIEGAYVVARTGKPVITVQRHEGFFPMRYTGLMTRHPGKVTGAGRGRRSGRFFTAFNIDPDIWGRADIQISRLGADNPK